MLQKYGYPDSSKEITNRPNEGLSSELSKTFNINITLNIGLTYTSFTSKHLSIFFHQKLRTEFCASNKIHESHLAPL